MANLPVALFTSLTPASVGPNGLTITMPFVSNLAKGTGYYGRTDGMHTVQYSTTNHFTGKIKLQATLSLTPTDLDWFDIDNAGLDGSVTPVPDGAVVKNFTGNFVWVRAVITSFPAGGINKVLFTHN